ncbi:MAG: RecQ family ATP-dependent DNA helicase, partial [Ignavibacteriaceae bacterium]|nr:RecQ family ATP-dependent DNA helicase [Ignavibacteriaceae bacterium]
TGGGKSLVYYLAGLSSEHTTLVISPLKALMQEQVNFLISKNIQALSFNSDIPFSEQRKILRNLETISYRFIYVSPERLQDSYFRAAILHSKIQIDLVVIDEAHCISQWGYDFRPEYGEIPRFINFLRFNGIHSTVLALTATLSQKAIKDIKTEFNIKNIFYSNNNLIRQELKLFFEEIADKTAGVDKWNRIIEFLKTNNSKKILIYFYSKKKCEELSKKFNIDEPINGLVGDYFHADLDETQKKEKYNLFKTGKINVLFTTTAFGMGMNIPDIDTIIQYHLPKSIEDYYQQVGRGARVKEICKECKCLLFWSKKNITANINEYKRGRFTSEKISKGIDHLLSKKDKNSISSVSFSTLKNGKINISVLRYYLERLGLIEIVGEVNGGPDSIRFKNDTPLWLEIKNASLGNSFIIAAKKLGRDLQQIINYVYEQDLIGNVEYSPAIDKKLFIKRLFDTLPENKEKEIIAVNDARIDYQTERFNELINLIRAPDPYVYLRTVFKEES